MGIISYVVLGLIIGTIAKALFPGRHSGGWFTTMLLGVVGAMVGGLLGNWFFDTDLGKFFNLRTWALALLGTVVVLLIYGAVTGRKRDQS